MPQHDPAADTVRLTLDVPRSAFFMASPLPLLVSRGHHASLLAMTDGELEAVLRQMAADPTWGKRTVRIARRRLAAEPHDVLAFLRSRRTEWESAAGLTAAEPVAPITAETIAAEVLSGKNAPKPKRRK